MSDVITQAEWHRHLERVRDERIAKSVGGPLPQAFLDASDITWRNEGARLQNPYAQSSWVYTAVCAIAEAVAQIPFRITRGQRGGEDLVEGEPINALFDQPHPLLNRYLFWELILTWYCLRGEVFIVALDENDGVLDWAELVRMSRMRSAGGKGGKSQIAKLMVLSPDMFWHIVVGYTLEAWRFTGQPLMSPLPSQILLPTEVLFDRKPNPWLFWRGMSPLTVAMLAAESDYAASAFAKGYMMNNADQGIIVETDQDVGDEQRGQIMAALRERKRKAGTADRPLILWGGFKVARPPLTSIDAQFVAQRKMNRQEIAAIFKVPEVLMGFTEDANRAITEGQRLNFIENTISPFCRRLEALVDPIVKSHGGDLYGWFDIDSLPILQQARRDRVAVAQQLFALGYPVNDINQYLDLGLPTIAWGDKGYLPFTIQEVGGETPAQQAADTPPDTGTDSIAPVDRALSLLGRVNGALRPLGEHACAAHPDFEASIAGSVKLKRGRLGKFFLGQRQRVLSRIHDVHRGAGQAAGVNKAINDLFDAQDENAKLLGTMKPLLIADLQFGGAQLFEEIGAGDFHLAPEDAIKFLQARENKITSINDTVYGELKDSLSEGLQAGETYEQLVGRVKAIYNSYGMDDPNVERIASTETVSATNGGRFTAMKAAKVKKKAWQTSHLENTRATHLQAEATSREGIPIDAEFSNGLMFPGDPKGPPGETINCRCYLRTIIDGASAAPRKLLTFSEFATRNGFVGRVDPKGTPQASGHSSMGFRRFAMGPGAGPNRQSVTFNP